MRRDRSDHDLFTRIAADDATVLAYASAWRQVCNLALSWRFNLLETLHKETANRVQCHPAFSPRSDMAGRCATFHGHV